MIEDTNLQWKSEIDPYYCSSFFIFTCTGFIFLCLPFIILISLLGLGSPSAIMGVEMFGWFFFLFFFSLATIFFWIGLKFRVNYLEIYENGIKIRTPERPLKQREIPYEDIVDLSIGKMPKYYGSYNQYRSSPSKRLHIDFDKIVIYFRNGKPYQISGAWVYDLATAKQLIESKIAKPLRNLICHHCKKDKMIRRCDGCGVQTCSNCSENDECLKCRLKRHHKRALISFGFSSIPPIILIIWVLIENVPLFHVFCDAKGNVFAIYYFFFNPLIGILGTAYGLGIWVVELRVLKKIKQTSGTVNYIGFLFISVLGTIILSFKILYFVQIINSNQPDLIVVLVVEIIFALIIIYSTYRMNKK